MGIKAIIHDWDDTITNSFHSYSEFYKDFGFYYKLDTPSMDSLRENWGGTIPEIVSGIWPSLSVEDAEIKVRDFGDTLRSWRRHYNADVFPNVKNTIEYFNSLGITLGIISSGNSEQMKRLYREQIHPDLIYHSFIFDGDDLGFKKPDSRVFDMPFDLLSQSNIFPEEAIYVGDSFQDYYPARDRGIVFYTVTTGVKTRKDFLDQGLDSKYILGDFNELKNII